MNTQIRRLGIGLLVCYVAVFAMLNWVQVIRAGDYNDNALNTAQIRADFNRPRGTISTVDGTLLAQSIDNPDPDSEFERVRVYPEGDLFGHVTGFFSFKFGATGLERSYSDQLAGTTVTQQLRGWRDLFVSEPSVGNVVISLRTDLQRVARDQLGEREGSVVALDPRTGELLAFWSYPSYDPNLLSTLDLEAADFAWGVLNLGPGQPLRAHMYQDRYFPGSTFKVVTASTGVETGEVTPERPSYPVERTYTPPLTTVPISNFGGRACGGRLFEVLAVSCNTAFARMGVETLGADALTSGAEAFGFNDTPPIDLPAPAPSVFPTDFTRNTPKLAQAAIGQNDVQATPLQMALVAAAVGNGGRIMRPHLMTEVLDADRQVVERYEVAEWRRPLSEASAAVMREAMVDVVTDGTAGVLDLPGVEVGAKTGTAQLGTDPPRSHTWIIAFAGPPGAPAEIALAVVVLNQPGASEFTGGSVAGPIARAVLEAYLANP